MKSVDVSFNFREVNSGKVSDDTLAAAAYLSKQVFDSGMNLIPFFISDAYKEKLSETFRDLYITSEPAVV